MKRSLSLLLVLLMILPLGMSAWAEEKPATADSGKTVIMSKADIIKMSNYMNWDNYCHVGDWLVHEAYVDSRLTIHSTKQKSGESINFGERAEYIIPDGLWFIYLASDVYGGNTCIKRAKVSGADHEVLIAAKDLPDSPAGVFQSLQEYEGKLYFSFNNESNSGITGAFYSANKDGSNITKVLDKAVYYPYFLGDKLYYQDDADDCRLHVCNPDGSGDKVFIDDLCFEYVTDGEYFYYSSFSGEVEWNENHLPTNDKVLDRALKKYSPETGIEIIEGACPFNIAYDGDKIYYSEQTDSNRLYSCDPVTGQIDIMYLQTNIFIKQFIKPGILRCMVVDSNGKFQKYVTAKLDGTSMS